MIANTHLGSKWTQLGSTPYVHFLCGCWASPPQYQSVKLCPQCEARSVSKFTVQGLSVFWLMATKVLEQAGTWSIRNSVTKGKGVAIFAECFPSCSTVIPPRVKILNDMSGKSTHSSAYILIESPLNAWLYSVHRATLSINIAWLFGTVHGNRMAWDAHTP